MTDRHMDFLRVEFTEHACCPMGCPSATGKLAATPIGSGPFSDQRFEVLQCSECGLGRTHPVPTEATAPNLYSGRESIDFQPDDPEFVVRLKAFSARRDIRRLCHGLDLPANGRFLDYGCGNGAFVRALQEVYPAATALGADFQVTPPPLLSERNYRSYESLNRESSPFDLVLCRHVLEHTYHPVETLRSLRALLAPNGILLIEVPSLDTAMRRLFGKYWDSYYAPYHPLHFTRASLKLAVESAGLRVIREGGEEMPKVGRSLQRVFGCGYNPLLFCAGVALHPLQIAIGRLTGTAVCLRIWAANTSVRQGAVA